MSSSSTDTTLVDVVDAADGRLGRRGHDRRVAQAGRATGSSTRRRSSTSRPTRSTPRSRRRPPGRVAEIVVEVGTTVDVGTVLARIATDASPGRRTPPSRTARRPRARPRRPPADAGRGDRDAAPEPGAATPDDAPRRGARPAPAATRPVVQRIAAEHGVDLDQVQGTGRDGRVRKQDVLAFIECRRCAARRAEREPPLHIESPYRPEPPAPKPAAAAAPARAGRAARRPRRRLPAARGRSAVAHAQARSAST